MALRLMTVVLAPERAAELQRLLVEKDIQGCWIEKDDEQLLANLLVEADKAEPLMDDFDQALGHSEGFRLMLLPVEATLPRPKEEAPPGEQKEESNNHARVSREELYAQAQAGLSTGRTFLLMSFLSALVAAVGLVRDDLAIIIGAMVIAPLLAPNIALALATTMGDLELGREALITNGLGVALTLALAIGVAQLLTVDPTVPAIAARTTVGLGDIILALAAGAAGTLAFTSGQSSAVIGVMVAVALMPPLVTCGMLLGSGQLTLALGAALLVAINVICVNLAGVLTFLFQGVSPRYWWQQEKVRKATYRAVATWIGLLLSLLLLMALTG
ncbi:TIGR00341 family protein [Gallaecimonas sp. GXIMD4217]|uniref:TIGR00341 family protein n=1 Tax=Gallaecimonas sp. GXIMD4217 TaxID=3131927 RepID=UPI00311ABB2A